MPEFIYLSSLINDEQEDMIKDGALIRLRRPESSGQFGSRSAGSAMKTYEHFQTLIGNIRSILGPL